MVFSVYCNTVTEQLHIVANFYSHCDVTDKLLCNVASIATLYRSLLYRKISTTHYLCNILCFVPYNESNHRAIIYFLFALHRLLENLLYLINKFK